jgi:hypothetical protein
MDLKKELPKNKTLLLISPKSDYTKNIIDLLKDIPSSSICYITLNKTFDSLIELFKKNKINTENIVFVDAISSKIKFVPEQSSRVYYVPFTKIPWAMTKFLRHKFEYIIFDCLTDLLVYQRKKTVLKFVTYSIKEAKKSKTKFIFFAVSGEKGNKLISEIAKLMDKNIYLPNK